MSGVEDEVLNISRHFSSVLLRNRSTVRSVLRECSDVDGSYKLLELVEYLLKVPSIRGSLEEITCHVQPARDYGHVSLTAVEPYGAKIINFMLHKEKYFVPFRCSYYMLYQAFQPTTLQVALKRYTIPKGLETHFLKQRLNWRTKNQSLLNYLLIELRRDKDDVKFWGTLMMMVEKPQLKKVINNYASMIRNVSKETGEISSALCDKESFSGTAASPAVPFVGAADNLARRWIYSDKRYRHPTLHQNTFGGSSMDQQELAKHELLSYPEMADDCLKTVGTEKKLSNPNPGPPHNEGIREFRSVFAVPSELAMMRPNMYGVFQKYSSVLLDNFPENYMTSLEIMSQHSPIPCAMLETVTAPKSYVAVNKQIFDMLVHRILRSKTQVSTINSVLLLKKIIKDFNKNPVLLKFDNELTYAIAQDTSDTRLHNNSAVQPTHSDFRGGPDQSHHWVDSALYYSTPSAGGPDQSHQWTNNALHHSTPTTPVQKIEEMPDVIFSETNNLDKLKPKIVAVIKKYYVVLLKNFPKDHMMSLRRYSSIHKLADTTVDHIVAADNPDQANRRLFGYMTCIISPEHEDSLFTFCSNLEIVIGSQKMPNVIEQLRNDLVEAIFDDVNNSGKSGSHNVPQVDLQRSLSQQSLPSRQSSLSQPQSPHQSLVSQQPLSPQQPVSLPQQPVLSFQSFDDMSTSLNNEEIDDVSFNLGYELMASLPEDFKSTVECLRQHFSDDEVDDILSAPDYLTGNERISKILFNHAVCKRDPYTLCDILESIENAPRLPAVIKFLKRRFLYGREYAGVNNNTSDSVPQKSEKEESSQVKQQKREKLIAVLNKHYSAVLKSIPLEFNTTEVKTMSHNQRVMTKFNSRIANEMMFNKLVNEVVSPDYDKTPVDFCRMLLMLIGDTPAVRALQKDVLELLDRETASKAIASFQYTMHHRDFVMKEANINAKTDQDDEKEQEICLSSFDDYYDLLLKVNPRFAKVQFMFAFKFEHGDPLTGNLLFQHDGIQMEVLLVNVRNSIGVYGTECFLKLVDILCNQEPYKEIGYHMLDVYHAKGGCQISSSHYVRTGNPLPIEELTKRLEYHSKQLQAGLQYQPPRPLPEYYIPRPNLLIRMVKAIMDSDTGSIDVNLAIFGFSGYGKSTLAKALCYHDDIMRYFLDGFLWIKFGIGTVNHYSQLTKIYHQLTAMKFTGDQNLLIDKLKKLASDHLQRLLVIIYDVYQSDDVMLYLEIFRKCKVILLSTKEELHHFIPIKQHIVLGWKNIDSLMSIKLITARVDGFNNIDSEIFTQLKGLVEEIFNWPILLHLVHHQLLLYCNKYKLSPSSALQKVLQKLVPTKERKRAIMSCPEQVIEGNLEFLESKDVFCLNELLYIGGLEYVTPKCLLPRIWKVNEEVANQCMELLHSCGFLQYTEQLQLTESTYNLIPCVEIHTIVVQYLLLKMNKTTFSYDV